MSFHPAGRWPAVVVELACSDPSQLEMLTGLIELQRRGLILENPLLKGHEIHSQELQSRVAAQPFEFFWSKAKLQAQQSHVTAASTSGSLPSPCCLIKEPRGH